MAKKDYKELSKEILEKLVGSEILLVPIIV